MPDPKFFKTGKPISLSEAVLLANATVVREPKIQTLLISVESVSANRELDDCVVFARTADIASSIYGRKVGLCLAAPQIARSIEVDGCVAEVSDPYHAFSLIAGILHSEIEDADVGFIDHSKAPANCEIHPTALVSKSASIGDGVSIGPLCIIGPGVSLGEGTSLSDSVTLRCANIGRRVRISSGARIGGLGFGFNSSTHGLTRAPQLGRVLIGDDVEIGNNSSIDRGSLMDTVIGAGTKIDALVHIGHNVQVGANSIITAQVGVAGSSKIGNGVMLGGQAGIADHIEIGDGARIAAKSGVMRNVPAGETWGGYPAQPKRVWLKSVLRAASSGQRRKSEKDDD
ncbi:MAG: UDP-3-O-(3-hydroxymyristoyl)glucosamine N-acyltransferase [Parvularculaceae bacterium]|nr:UDP-3-O-(3-hydroxymyristoyl)glucosamine N-acyltransferase [Parvularculaceae bacterium]